MSQIPSDTEAIARHGALSPDLQLRVVQTGLFAMDQFSSQPTTHERPAADPAQALEIQALRQRVLFLESQVQGFQTLASDLAYANRQIAVLEEYKQLYLKKTAANSFQRGKQLEDLTEDSLGDLFPDAVVQRTTGLAHAGDFQLRFGDTLVLLECKNYSSPVDQREVDKFQSDAKTSGAQVALMVSLQSGIRGKKRVEVHREETRLLGFAVCRSEADVAGLGIMIRSMISTQSVFSAAAEQDQFINSAKQVQTNANTLVKEIDRYVAYNQKHVKSAKELAAAVAQASRSVNESALLAPQKP